MSDKKTKKERDEELNPINRRIAMYRRKAGYNQADVAKLLEMSPKTYGHMERHGKISGDMLKVLARIFRVPVVWLLEGENGNTVIPIEPKPKQPVIEKPEEVDVENTEEFKKRSTAGYIATVYEAMPSDLQLKIFDFVNNVVLEAKDRKKQALSNNHPK